MQTSFKMNANFTGLDRLAFKTFGMPLAINIRLASNLIVPYILVKIVKTFDCYNSILPTFCDPINSK